MSSPDSEVVEQQPEVLETELIEEQTEVFDLPTEVISKKL